VNGNANRKLLVGIGGVVLLAAGGLYALTRSQDGDSFTDWLLRAEQEAKVADGESEEATVAEPAAAAIEAGAGREDIDVARRREGGPRVLAADVLVAGADQLPLAEAFVEAWGPADSIDRTRTDEQGRAAVMLPPAETVRLRVTAPGHVAAAIADHPFGASLPVTLRKAAHCTLLVRDTQGGALKDVVVAWHGPAGTSRPPVTSQTDGAGRTDLDGLPPGTFDLVLTMPTGSACTRVWACGGVYLGAGPQQYELVIPPGRTLTGFVRSAGDGRPLAGARVNVRMRGRAGQHADAQFQAEARTGEDGSFQVSGLPIGEGRIVADADSHTRGFQPVVVRESSGGQSQDFALVASATLRGTVLTVDGVPVEDAEVVYGFFRDGTLRFPITGKSGKDGAFELTGVPARDGAFVAVRKDGLAPGGKDVPKLQPGEVREGIEVRFQKGIEVRGKVLAEDGPLPVVASVDLVPRLGADRWRRNAATDANGGYSFQSITPFPYRIEIRAEGFLASFRDVNVDHKVGVFDGGEVRLQRAYAVEGRVVLRSTLAGVAGARVRLIRPEPQPPLERRAVTDEFGGFLLEELARGRYRLLVDGADVLQPKQPELWVDVPANGKPRALVDLMQPPTTGIVAGRLRDQATGLSILDFVVRGLDPRRIALHDGSFTLRGVPAGTHDLLFASNGYQSIVVPGVHVFAGGVRDLHDLWLQPGGQLHLTVVNERGQPFPSGQVRVALNDKYVRTLSHNLSPVERQDDKGLFRYDGLALSQFELRVLGPPTHQPHVQTFDVLRAGPQPLRVVLRPKPPPKKATPKPQQKQPQTRQPKQQTKPTQPTPPKKEPGKGK
jgi:hypothetical protein